MKAMPEDFYADLGRRIQQARKSNPLTQAALGSLLDPAMTRASIANIETGKQRVLARTLVQFAVALNVSIEQLVPAPEASRDEVATRVETELDRKLPPDVTRRFKRKLQRLAETGGSHEPSNRTKRR